MKKLKTEQERRKRLSITLSPNLNNLIEHNTTNRSRYIEISLLEYFKNIGLDVKNIKI